jgi:multiple sugar transport system permease protein
MQKKRKITRNFTLLLIATLGAVIMTYPFLIMVSNALKTNVYVIEYPPELIPEHPSLQNFADAWSSNNFQLYFRNSAIVAVVSTALTVLFSAMSAYAFARFDFPLKSQFFTF